MSKATELGDFYEFEQMRLFEVETVE